jgi:hypothetical protein
MLRSVGVGFGCALALGCGDTINGGGGGGSDASTDGHLFADGPSQVDSGPATIATQVQQTPDEMLSDGVTLFWLSQTTPALFSMPVGGGATTTVVAANVNQGLLAVDDTSVYFQGNSGVFRVAKAGGSPVLVSDSDVLSATTFGSRVYWVAAQAGSSPTDRKFFVKSAPFEETGISVVAQFEGEEPGSAVLGVTASEVFLQFGTQVTDFPTADFPDGGMPKNLPGTVNCQRLLSDADAIYCYPINAPITRIGNDGTTTDLGEEILGCGNLNPMGALAIDDTYAYWIDPGTVGTLMRVPKTGGTATIIARDANPIAIAVDASFVYWNDMAGDIKRLAK